MRAKRLFIFIAAMFVVFANGGQVFAGVYAKGYNESDASAHHRIVFVIDISGSMNADDPDGIRSELVKMLVDSLPAARTHIGIVAFNNTIAHSRPLTLIDTQAARDNIKVEIDRLTTQSWTDIGIALKYAMDMLDGASSTNSLQSNNTDRSSIVFISDGEGTNNPAQPRTMEDALADERETVERAIRHGIPIHTISTNATGNFSQESMIEMANLTGGSWHEITNITQLPNMFETFFAELTGITPIRYDISATGSQQSIEIPIPHHHAIESNIIAWHNRALNGIRNQNPENIQNQNSQAGSIIGNITFGSALPYQSERFGSIKITNPQADSIEAAFTADYESQITFFAINHLDVFPVVEMPENISALNVPIEVRFHRAGNDSPLTDERYYVGKSAELVITNTHTGQVSAMPMENTGTSFTALYDNTLPGPMELHVNVSGGNYGASSLALPITFTNTPPIILQSAIPAEIRRQNNTLTLDLNDFFYDADGDALTFEILGGMPDRIGLHENIMTIDLNIRGGEDFQLHASDGRGGVAAHQITFDVVPWWIYFRMAFLIIATIFFILLSLYIIFFRRVRRIPVAAQPMPLSPNTNRFSNDARFEGYFLNTLSGNDIPILNWNARYIENKQTVSLGEMFNMLDVEERLPEAHKIFFEAGSNHTVIFHHMTDCVVTLGNKDVPRGKKEVLNFDNRLYIVFEDHSTEIEIRYKRMKRAARVSVYS